MTDILTIENHGPIITASNYWDSPRARGGYLYLSVNAGAFRLLVPDGQRSAISDMRPGAKHIVVSMLPRAEWAEWKYCAEWMVEDGTETPWSCHISPSQIDRVPSPEDVGKQWIGSVWLRKNGRPHKCLERPAYYQVAPTLPWLRRIEK